MKKYTEIKTFEDACEFLNLNPKEVIPSFLNYPKNDRKSMIAHSKLVIIIKAANKLANNGKEWKPNFNNTTELKYEPWFNMGSSGRPFEFVDYGHWHTYSTVGSRLCFKNRAVLKYIVNTFIELYKTYLL